MEETRIDSEWIALNAFRGLLKIATKGDVARSTYNIALKFGGELYPQLLGAEKSLLHQARESDTAKEFRQRANLQSIKDGIIVHPLDVLLPEIELLEGLLRVASINGYDRSRIDQLKNKLAILLRAKDDLSPEPHSENQLIFRDAYNVERVIPKLEDGRGYRDFRLPNANILRIRVLHPDTPERVSGADILYERHAPLENKASLVAVQYKIWDNKKLYLSDDRMTDQLTRLARFVCGQGICSEDPTQKYYRFPHCAAFLRPTDRLQKQTKASFPLVSICPSVISRIAKH